MTLPATKIESITIQEFQSNFDQFFDRVENGESIVITSEYGKAIIVPYIETVKIFSDDDIMDIYTNHEEGS